MHSRRFDPLTQAIACLLLILLAACESGTGPGPAPVENPAASAPQQSRHITPTSLAALTPEDRFGDGFTARIPIEDVKNHQPVQVIDLLLTKWLEHYQNDTQDMNFKLDAFAVVSSETVPSDDPTCIFAARIHYRIKINSQAGHDWYAGAVGQENDWMFRNDTFGYFQDGEYYRLKVLAGPGNL